MAVFFNLSAEEEAFLIKTPAIITILIAGADSDIDKAEIQEAKEIIYRIKENASSLSSFYNQVIENFEINLDQFLGTYPTNTRERNQIISEELKLLNHILPNLELDTAINFYSDMKQLARHIAEASGGVLGYLSVDKEESKYMNLPMIKNPEEYWSIKWRKDLLKA